MSQRPRLQSSRWEAVYTDDFTLDSLRRRVEALAVALATHGWSCLVAHDTRFLSSQFARYAFAVLQLRGVRAEFCPTPVPFPAIELALHQRAAGSALIVSAGNRPHWYNGLIMLAPLSEIPPAAAELAAVELPFPPAALEDAPETQVDLRTPYLDLLRSLVDVELIRRAALTIFVDPMNGSSASYIPAILGEGAQTKAIEINKEVDPLFGRQPPQPVESGLVRLRKLVRESDSHLGLAISADGRALGAVETGGTLLPPTDVALLLARYLSQQYRQRGAVVVPQASDSTALQSWEEATGLKVEAVEDPAGRIAELLSQDRNSLLAGTTSVGELTLGRFSASPDALIAALLLIEMTARAAGKFRALLDEQQAFLSGT